MLRLLHTADWQIGRQYGRFDPDDAAALAAARFDAVERIAALATAERVDAVLVAGDVFDAQSVSARTIRRLFNATAAFAGPWLMIPGNHDAALAEGVWAQAQRLGAVPHRVRLALAPRVLELPDLKLAALCAPLTQRHTHDDLTGLVRRPRHTRRLVARRPRARRGAGHPGRRDRLGQPAGAGPSHARPARPPRAGRLARRPGHRRPQSLAFSNRVAQRLLALEAHAALADLQYRVGNTNAAFDHLRDHQALRDTIFDQSAAQRIASMEARAETERQLRENARLRAEQAAQAAIIGRQRLVVVMGSVILALVFVVVGQLVYTNRRGRSRELLLASANHQLGVANADLARTNAELRDAMTEVRALTGLIPICSHCRQVRDDQGYWQAVETYVANHSSATFSHSICQSCGPELFGEYWTDAESERDASTGSEPGAAAQTEAPGK